MRVVSARVIVSESTEEPGAVEEPDAVLTSVKLQKALQLLSAQACRRLHSSLACSRAFFVWKQPEVACGPEVACQCSSNHVARLIRELEVYAKA
jgi:hypothetical protein